MKNKTYNNQALLAICCLVIAFFGCKPKALPSVYEKEKINIPEELRSVMDAHGGLSTWKSMRSMSYEMGADEDVEKQYIDLWDRRELIETTDYSMGYDGKNFWTEADTSVKQNPIFYKNLMFYFYAMPFVLADDGIVYDKADNLMFDGVAYPGFKISYENEVGVSPEDEYFIHYDAKTHEMAWLGYTVTYYSKEKSSKIKWIRYDDWKEWSGLKLPASMMWYKNENNKPFEERSRRVFNKVKVSTQPFLDSKFEQTEAARIVTE